MTALSVGIWNSQVVTAFCPYPRKYVKMASVMTRARNFWYLPINVYRYLTIPFLGSRTLFTILWKNDIVWVSLTKTTCYQRENIDSLNMSETINVNENVFFRHPVHRCQKTEEWPSWHAWFFALLLASFLYLLFFLQCSIFAAHFKLSRKSSTTLEVFQQTPMNQLRADLAKNAKLKSEHSLQG